MSRNLNDLMLEKWVAMSEDERKTWTMQRGLFPELCEILQPREDESCSEGAARVVAERDRLRDGMLALLGGDDYLTEYECGHGTPIGSPCYSDCPLNPTRLALGIAGHIEE